MNVRKSIPSMFHRRLLLLGALVVGIMVVLLGQLTRLAIADGEDYRAKAEKVLNRRSFLPTVRGTIYDRHGRVLAVDHAGYNVAVRYDVITGSWAFDQAMSVASDEVGNWSELTIDERQQAANAYLAEFEATQAAIWESLVLDGGADPDELEERRGAIVRRIHRQAAAIRERARRTAAERYEDGAETFVARPIREETIAHVVLNDVSDEAAFHFMAMADSERFDGLIEVHDTGHREYPWDAATIQLARDQLPRDLRRDAPILIDVSGVADHILGSVRQQVWKEDIDRRPFFDPATNAVADLKGYRPGDVVGSRGLERSFEDSLRGARGVVYERRDTGARERIEAEPGRDLHLTLDIVLQQKIQAVLSPEFGLTRVQPWHGTTLLPMGTELNAAAVVIEVETGEILSMVTMPTIAMADRMTEVDQNIRKPWYNRAIEVPIVPGSIVKPLALVSGVTEGVMGINEEVECRGHYFPELRTGFRCWIYRERYGMASHGPLGASEALGRSCNIFFYTIGDRLGLDRLYDWYRYFGMGTPLDIGLARRGDDGQVLGEHGGILLTEDQISERRGRGELRSEVIMNAIGQGAIGWTPVHAANAYAMLARGGSVRDATLLLERPGDTRPERAVDRRLDPAAVRAALEGLRQSVEETYGTGHHIRYTSSTDWDKLITAEGVRVWAKTGTAQAPPLHIDINGDGRSDEGEAKIRHLDHSWWVGLVGPQGSDVPLYAIAVLVEYGGSGGRVSGPIASEIIRALQAEEYLPGGRR